MAIPSVESVKDYQEKIALKAVIRGQKAPVTNLKDTVFRDAIIALNNGAPIRSIDAVKDYNAKRILKHIKNTGV